MTDSELVAAQLLRALEVAVDPAHLERTGCANLLENRQARWLVVLRRPAEHRALDRQRHRKCQVPIGVQAHDERSLAPRLSNSSPSADCQA